MKDLVPAHATHPGEIIADELLARSMNQVEFAGLIGMNTSQLNEILNGKRGINAELALLLEKALGIDADYWMTAQSNFELDLARINEKVQARIQSIEEWSLMKEQIAYDFLKKQKFISGNPVEDVSKVKEIYGINKIDDLASMYASQTYTRYRKTDSKTVDRINIVGWTKLISYMGSKQQVSKFKVNKEQELIVALKKILVKNIKVKEKVKSTLADAGIKLIYQKNASKCPVDGVVFWSENKNPLIGMSLRYERLDNFAFTLFHELGHVFRHLINQPNATFIDDLESTEHKKEKEEKEANEFASDKLISKEDWETFMNNEQRMLDSFAIEFANKIQIHPAIVKGRLKYEFKAYSLRTKIDNTLT